MNVASYVPTVLEALKGEKFDTVFEPACGNGQVLNAIDHEFLPKSIEGCDIEDKWGYPICDITKLDTSKKYDLVVIAATLLLFDDDTAEKILADIKKMAKKLVLLVELQGEAHKNVDNRANRFQRDYRKYFPNKEIMIYPLQYWISGEHVGSVIKIRV